MRPSFGAPNSSFLEGEFRRLSHVHVPINFSPVILPNHQEQSQNYHSEEFQDDLFGNFTDIKLEVSPTLHVSTDNFSLLINQENAPINTTEIVSAQSQSPFLLIENKQWDLGLGAEMPNLPLINLVGAGIGFFKGKRYFSVRLLDNKKQRRSRLELPLSNIELKKWKVGDQIVYASRGGAIFNILTSVEPFITLGPEYSHFGSYVIKAELIAKDLMQIEFNTTKTDGISFNGITYPGRIELSRNHKHIDSLVYQFDLRDPDALLAIKYLLHARFDLTNKEMLKSNGKIILSTQLQQNYISVSGKGGIPLLLMASSARYRSQTNGPIEISNNGKLSKFQVYSSSRVKDFFSRGYLSRNQWMNKTISSSILRGLENQGSVLSSSYSWIYSKRKMDLKSLKRKLIKLGNIFRSNRLETLKFPASQLGYLKTTFSINLNGADILHLLDSSELFNLKEQAILKLRKDFDLLGHREFCRLKPYHYCLNSYQNLIENKYLQIKFLTESLEADYQEKRIEKVSKKLTKIIDLIFNSRYLTEAFINQRPGVKLELRFEGEKIKRHLIQL